MTMIERNARWTAGSAIVLCALAFAFSTEIGIAAVAGGVVACVSAFLVQRLAIMFSTAGDRVRPILALLLVGKTGLVLGLSAFFLSRFHLHGLGFALGVSALVAGAMGAAISGFLQGSGEPPSSASPSSTTSSTGPEGLAQVGSSD